MKYGKFINLGKRALFLVLSIYFILFTYVRTALAASFWPSAISIEADGGILMEAQTGTVLFAKNADQPYYPASITKILTALIVLEHCSLDEEVTFSHDDVYNVEAGSSTAGIDEGDVLTVRDCLYALMLASANESANALACHVSGSREAFAELMNQTAESLGCTGSHFANPSGLNDENHYTTAHDMALIARAAIQNPDFLEIDGARNYKLPPTKRNPEGGYVANHHRMLVKNTSVYYPGAFAGKTGYTSIAGNTLVTCAQRNDMTLIAVVLNGHQTHYPDTKALLDFGFDRFQILKAADHETTYKALDNDMTIGGMTAQDNISLELDKNSLIVIPKDADFSDTESSLSYELDENAPDTAIARILYQYDGHSIGQVYLCSAGQIIPKAANRSTQASDPVVSPQSDTSDTVNARSQASAGRSAASSQTGKEFPFILVGICALSLTAIGVILFFLLHSHRKEKEDLLLRRKRRLERLEDIGYSSSDFDQMLSQKRSSSPSYQKQKRKIKRPHKKWPFSR